MCVHYEGESYLYSVFVTLARAGPGLGEGWARAGEGECKVGQTLRGCLRVQWENTREKVVIYQSVQGGAAAVLLFESRLLTRSQDITSQLLHHTTPMILQ